MPPSRKPRYELVLCLDCDHEWVRRGHRFYLPCSKCRSERLAVFELVARGAGKRPDVSRGRREVADV